MKNKYTLFVTDHNPSGVGGGAFATRAFINAFSQIEKNKLVIIGVSSINDDTFINTDKIRLIKVKPRYNLQKD